MFAAKDMAKYKDMAIFTLLPLTSYLLPLL